MSTDQSLPAAPAPKPPSRWSAFFDRWNAGAERGEPLYERFKASFNAFSLMSDRRVNPWLLALLSAAVLALAALTVYGAVWGVTHHRVFVIFILLKSAKWALLGGALLVALVLRNWVMPKHSGTEGAEPAPK
jgi:hypothetical protein